MVAFINILEGQSSYPVVVELGSLSILPGVKY